MDYTYKILSNFITGAVIENMVRRLPDNADIPFDPANTDYQAFLLWKAEGNTPEPADNPQQGETP